MKPLADVIVPVFNEAEILATFFQRLSALNLPLNLIFIDNASTDNSCNIINHFKDVTLIRHQTNEGYGGSILDGIRQSSNDNIIIIDADCEFPPECIPDLLQALKNCNVVHASRLLNKKNAASASMPYIKWLGNCMISGLFNGLFNQQTTDLYTGCKAIKRSALNGMILRKTGFEHVLELSVRLAQSGQKIHEIPVDFSARSTGSSKMKHVSELGKFIFLILYFYFKKIETTHEK